jgi:hypothetical protein
MKRVYTFGKAVSIVAFLMSANGYAQTPAIAPNHFYTTSVRQAVGELIEDQQSIFSGPSYDQYFTRLTSNGHPYYDLKGISIEYNQIEYRNITFLYDTYLDEVVVLRPDEKSWITVDKNRVSQINLGGHIFRYVKNVSGLKDGFYQIAATGTNAQLLAKWTKSFRASTWTQKVSLFIVKDKAYPVKSKKSLLQIFNDRQSEIRQFIKENDLKFKQNNVEDYSKVVRYYSSLVQ